MEPTSLLRDDPLPADGEDLFRRRPLAQRLASLVRSVASADESVVFAVVGAWGSGKTSLLHMMEGELADDVRVVRFNPWLVGSVDDLLRDFFATLSDAIPDAEPWGRVRDAIGSYGRVAAPVLRVVPGAAALSDLAGVLAGLNDPKPLGRLREEAEDALKSMDDAFVVVIDDIDRLQPDELLVLLKLIRLVGRLPKVHYVLAFDEETLLTVLGSRTVAAGEARSIEYLEKIVQVRVDIPGLHPADLDSLVSQGIEQVLRAAEVELDQSTLDRLRREYARHVRPGLRQPRQVARLFTQMQTVLPLVAGEVDVVDLFLLTYLRMRWPTLYGLLPGWADELPATLRVAARNRTVAEDVRRVTWESRIDNAVPDVAEREAVKALMTALFPGFASAFGKPRSRDAELSTGQRIGSEDYFFRYFQLGIPADDLPDSMVTEAMEDLGRGASNSLAVEVLRRTFRDQPTLVTDKMLAQWIAAANPAWGSVALCAFLLEARPYLAERHDLLRPPDVIDQWVATVAYRWPDDVLESNLRAARLLSPANLRSLVRGLRWLAEDYATERADLQKCEALAIDAVEEWLRSETHRPIESDELPWVLAYLAELGHEEMVRGWVETVLDTTAWTLVDYVGCFVSIMRPSSGVGSPRLGDLYTEYLGRTLPLTEIVERLRHELDAAGIRRPSVADGDVSLASRSACALSDLRRMRDDQDSLIPNDENSPIAALRPGNTTAPLAEMDLTLRVAIALPEPVVSSPGAGIAWIGQPAEDVLENRTASSGLSAVLNELRREWGAEDRQPHWVVQASSQGHNAEAYFTDHDTLVPPSGVAGRIWLAVRGSDDEPSQAAAIEVVADVGINLKELGADRRPGDVRHETTPAPIPAALKLPELVQILGDLVRGAEDLLSLAKADLGSGATSGQIGLWITTGGGAGLDRFLDLTQLQERRPGGPTNSEHFRAAQWPIPTATLDPPNIALAKSAVAKALQRAGYRNFTDALGTG